MGKDAFKTLPQELRIEILSRLPVDSIGKCKCVCKAWRELIEGSEFATWHRSRWRDSCVAAMADLTKSKPYRIWAFDSAGSSTRAVASFGFPDECGELTVDSSVNGLLLLRGEDDSSGTLLISNPMTREYIKIPTPPPGFGVWSLISVGFGASRVSGEYKVVIIFDRYSSSDDWDDDVHCRVYSLGLGLWRPVAIIKDPYIWSTLYAWNGNLHILEKDDNGDDSKVVSCFDLETELFTPSFPAPRGYGGNEGRLSVLDGRLCLFEYPSQDEICIWLMNRYGDGNSWVKEYAIKTPPFRFYGVRYRHRLFPIKVFKDGGDILFRVEGGNRLCIYSNITKVFREYDLIQLDFRSYEVVVLTPSFLSLKTMGIRGCHVEASL